MANLKSILSTAIALAMLGALTSAMADETTSKTQCRFGKFAGHYFSRCETDYESQYSTSRTVCAAGPVDSACRTTREEKLQPSRPEPPKPIKPPSVEKSWRGPLVIRGLPE